MLFVIGLIRNAIRNSRSYAKQYYDFPVICICEVQGRVGFVLRRDYDKASTDFWKQYRTGKVRYDKGHICARYGRYLEVKPVFVLRAGSKEFKDLTYGYCERATFEVPLESRDDAATYRKAYEYFYGKEQEKR